MTPSAISNVVEVSELDVLFEWARAEVHEWGPKEPEASRLLLSDGALAFGVKQGIVSAFRRGIARRDAAIERLGEITRGATRWYAADFSIEALGGVVLHPHWANKLLESRTACGLPACAPIVEEFAKHDVDSGFRLRDESPRTFRPIFITPSPNGLWRIAEGSHRCDAMWKLSLREAPEHRRPFEVFLGVHARMDEWTA